MKKLYLASIVFLLSLLAVSAGEYPDDDHDGLCETPFCDKLDLCPKIACEQLGLPVENCENPDNTDTDGDGAGDVCDECPTDRTRVRGPCPPTRRPSGGGGGGGQGTGCRSHTDFRGDMHKPLEWQCITDSDCQNFARKMGAAENDLVNYVCTITERRQGAGATQNDCACSFVMSLGGAPPVVQPPSELAQAGGGAPPALSQPVALPVRAPSAPVPPPYAGHAFETAQPRASPVVWLIPALLVIAAVVMLAVWWRRRQVY